MHCASQLFLVWLALMMTGARAACGQEPQQTATQGLAELAIQTKADEITPAAYPRKSDLKPYETTGALLDEAATVANETPPGLGTEEIREMLDPLKFIARHTNVGDPHPAETLRLIGVRRQQLEQMAQRQSQRRQRLDAAEQKLMSEIQSIIAEGR